MSKGQLIAMWAGIALLVASWMFPPWQRGTPPKTWHLGLIPIFSPSDWTYGASIDSQRLTLIDISIAALTAGVIVTLRRKS